MDAQAIPASSQPADDILAECAALMEVERQVREEIAIRHMVGFGRGFTASARVVVVRQVTTKDEG